MITNYQKQNHVEALINGYAIQVTHFGVGNTGHDPDSPISCLTPDPTLNPNPTVSGDRLPEDLTFGPKLIDSYVVGTDFTPFWTCTLEKGEATGIISSYYLFAKFVTVPVLAPLLINKLWIFSYSYSPFSVKTDGEKWTLQMGTRF